jgi:hypothetical protein
MTFRSPGDTRPADKVFWTVISLHNKHLIHWVGTRRLHYEDLGSGYAAGMWPKQAIRGRHREDEADTINMWPIYER